MESDLRETFLDIDGDTLDIERCGGGTLLLTAGDLEYALTATEAARLRDWLNGALNAREPLDAACNEVLATWRMGKHSGAAASDTFTGAPMPGSGATMREAWLGGLSVPTPDSECARGSGCVCARPDDADEPDVTDRVRACVQDFHDDVAALQKRFCACPNCDGGHAAQPESDERAAGYIEGNKDARDDAEATKQPDPGIDMLQLRMWAAEQVGGHDIPRAAELVRYALGLPSA
jgi:hypothetical protein